MVYVFKLKMPLRKLDFRKNIPIKTRKQNLPNDIRKAESENTLASSSSKEPIRQESSLLPGILPDYVKEKNIFTKQISCSPQTVGRGQIATGNSSDIIVLPSAVNRSSEIDEGVDRVLESFSTTVGARLKSRKIFF